MERRRQWAKTNCNKKNITLKKSYELISNSIQTCPTTIVLEEGCHILYCCGEIGSSTCSPDSWCRRFFHRDSSSKIVSKFHKPIFASFVQSEIPLSLVSSLFLWSETICMVFFCKFVQLLFCPSDCESCFAINWISGGNRSWIPLGCSPRESTFLQHLFHASQATWYSFCSSVLPCRAPWLRPLFIMQSRIERAVFLLNFLLDSFLTKNCPQMQYTIPRFQERRQWEHCTLVKVPHNSNNSTLHRSRIIAVELLLNGL